MMSTVATPPTVTSLLQSREEVADGTMAFRFGKPLGWVFKAGQFLDMTLVNPAETDDEGNSRSFSIASGPDEDTLMVATRMRDMALKRVVKTMPIGSAVSIEGPFGDLTLQNDSTRSAVFLAGGIGITPFRSMIVHAAHQKLSHRLFLFYSNRRPEDAPFLEELQALEKENPHYTLIPSMSEMATSHRPWTGETRVIDQAMLSRQSRGIVSPLYYIAGPPEMVKDLHAILIKQSVNECDNSRKNFPAIERSLPNRGVLKCTSRRHERRRTAPRKTYRRSTSPDQDNSSLLSVVLHD
jgi:ferredoxin-NADP reductase